MSYQPGEAEYLNGMDAQREADAEVIATLRQSLADARALIAEAEEWLRVVPRTEDGAIFAFDLLKRLRAFREPSK